MKALRPDTSPMGVSKRREETGIGLLATSYDDRHIPPQGEDLVPKKRRGTVSMQANSDSVHAAITRVIDEHAVVLFMKGEPSAPECGFSATVVKILDYLGIDFVGVDVLKNPAVRPGVKVFSHWQPLPDRQG